MEVGFPGRTFCNWANTYSCEPELVFKPSCVGQLVRILKQAKDNGKRIRVCGKGHSPSDIACTTDYLVYLDLFDKVLEVDTKKCTIKVEAGMVIKNLNTEVLPQYNMALMIQGSVSEITVGGSISTGTHGTGKNVGTMSTYVVELELLTAAGEVMKCSREENTDIFLAASCGLGCLGILTTVTLQCQPYFKLHQKQLSCTLDEMLMNLEKHIADSEYFRFCWFPHTKGVTYWLVDKTTSPKQSSSNWFWDYAFGYHLLQLLYWISTFIPRLVPSINWLFFKMLHSHPRDDIDDYYNIFIFECLFKQYVTDWAIPREKTGQVLQELNLWLQANSSVKAHFPVEVRFAKRDDLLLSPCYHQDTCFINIVMYRPYGKHVDHDRYWTAYENIMLKAGGRPHWAKAHPLTGTQLKSMYPEFQKFSDIRQQLDPDGRFLNAYMKRIFFPKSKDD